MSVFEMIVLIVCYFCSKSKVFFVIEIEVELFLIFDYFYFEFFVFFVFVIIEEIVFFLLLIMV